MTIVDMARSILHEKGMPHHLWGDAVNTAVYLLNRCPTKAMEKLTPFEAYNGRKPSVKHLKVFRSVYYVHIPTQLRHKLEETSEKCVFIGYGSCQKGYRLFNVNTQRVIISKDVVFDERPKWSWESNIKVHLLVPLNAYHLISMEYQDHEELDMVSETQTPT